MNSPQYQIQQTSKLEQVLSPYPCPHYEQQELQTLLSETLMCSMKGDISELENR